MEKIGSRYFGDGLVIAEWNSYTGGLVYPPDGVSCAEDYIIKRLFVTVQEVRKRPGTYDLVGLVEIEIVAIEDGIDEGVIELPCHEVYRVPFPHRVHDRKQILRQMREEPKFHLVS